MVARRMARPVSTLSRPARRELQLRIPDVSPLIHIKAACGPHG
jgi:hypothetical protein